MKKLYPSMTGCVMVLLCLLFVCALLTGCGAVVYETVAKEEESGESGTLSATEAPEEPALETEALSYEGRKTDTPDPGKEPESIYVYVCGAVRRAGVYEFPAGARLFQAIEAAGGLTEEADASAINQAAELSDGQQITVLTKEEREKGISRGETGVTPDTFASAGQGPAAEGGKININTADAETLTSLKGIGEARAADIVAYREAHGTFDQIEDIMKVNGIKNAVFEKIRDRITVE